jgi:hypothetical protein
MAEINPREEPATQQTNAPMTRKLAHQFIPHLPYTCAIQLQPRMSPVL